MCLILQICRFLTMSLMAKLQVRSLMQYLWYLAPMTWMLVAYVSIYLTKIDAALQQYLLTMSKTKYRNGAKTPKKHPYHDCRPCKPSNSGKIRKREEATTSANYTQREESSFTFT